MAHMLVLVIESLIRIRTRGLANVMLLQALGSNGTDVCGQFTLQVCSRTN